MTSKTHAELKTALKILGENITGFSDTLEKPDGSGPVSHTYVIRVAQGHAESDWVSEAIQRKIDEGKAADPEYFKAEVNFLMKAA